MNRFLRNQSRVSTWVRKVFSEKEATDAPERALRMAEEALELAQACGVNTATLHRLVDYVMSRPVGKPAQEIAGTMVTVYALAGALGVDADSEFETELERIQRPEVIERCQRRQHEKRAALEPKQVQAHDGGGTWFELQKTTPVYREDERIDAVRYSLQDAITWHIDRCDDDVPFDSLPDETVAKVFLKVLEERSLAIVDSIVAQLDENLAAPDDFCDDGKTGALK